MAGTPNIVVPYACGMVSRIATTVIRGIYRKGFMRKYQLSIILAVYDGTMSNEDSNELHVYADGNDVWGVICGGFQRLVNALVENGRHRPISFGCCEHQWKG